MRFTQVVLGVFVLVESCAGGRQQLCGEVILALQTSSKQKPLWSAESEEAGGREGGKREEWGRLSRFIARSREASTEHSFNQTVTSPPRAAQRLENRSLLVSLSCLRFCSHARRLSSERSAGSDDTCYFSFFFISKRE